MKFNKVLAINLIILTIFCFSCSIGNVVTPDNPKGQNNSNNNVDNNGNTNNNNIIDNVAPKKFKIDLNNIDTICLSDINIPSSTNTRAMENIDESVQTFSYIDKEGKITPFTFTAPSGKTFLLAGEKERYEGCPLPMKQFNNGTIAYRYSKVFQVTEDPEMPNGLKYTPVHIQSGFHCALIDTKTYDVYDLDGYELTKAASNKNYIFANGMGPNISNNLYKIDIKNLKAYPISLYELRDFFLFDDERIIEYFYMDYKIHFINEEKNPVSLDEHNMSVIYKDSLNEVPNFHDNWGIPMFIKDSKGVIHVVGTKGNKMITGTLELITNEKENRLIVKDAVEKVFDTNVSLSGSIRTNANLEVNPDSFGINYFEDNVILYVNKNNIIRFTMNDTLDVTVFNVDRDLTKEKIYLSNEGLYYIDDNAKKILFYDYSTQSFKEIYHNRYLFDHFNITDDFIIFYEAIGGTGVGTYTIKRNPIDGNLDKKLIAEHQINVEQIEKLNIDQYL